MITMLLHLRDCRVVSAGWAEVVFGGHFCPFCRTVIMGGPEAT